ncbi:hypothetical protein T492DRAFT_903889 [Pavlovales sp. CCMP2436]|nr:hypothetical protein T492DRAFT_903889 [Pavlovales sp. CCMP2436]
MEPGDGPDPNDELDAPEPGAEGYEEDEDEGMLDAEHPMLDRIQAALTKQLENNLRGARVDLGNKAEELKQARKEREDLGVELYQVQQALAKMQLHLEKTHENHNLISHMRDKVRV